MCKVKKCLTSNHASTITLHTIILVFAISVHVFTDYSPDNVAMANCRFEWKVIGDWGSCSVACGTGLQTRSVLCFSSISSAVVTPSLCQAAQPPAVQACGGSCDAPHWATTPWSPCNATCGGGSRSRKAYCMESTTQLATGTAVCSSQPMPAIKDECAVWPCESFAWFVGEWGPCNASCGSGFTSRSVVCLGSVTGAVQQLACTATVGPPPPSENPCGMEQCSPCSAIPQCSGHGTCGSTGACKCELGYSWVDCGLYQPCAAGEVLDNLGQCCAGTRDVAGVCCKAPLVVDGCGLCGGMGVGLDAAGACCVGVLDAAGLCCSGGRWLDECGVCGGSGSSCGVLLRYSNCNVERKGQCY